MAFDDGLGRVVLFGGSAANALGDTWEWDGSAWQDVPATGPGPRDHVNMAVDPAHGTLVLFGPVPRETWIRTGQSWSQSAALGPEGVSELATDRAGQRVLLVEGPGATGGEIRLWSWSGTSWAQQ